MRKLRRGWVAPLAGLLALVVAQAARATSVIPITDRELYRRADVVVHGLVETSEVTVDAHGRPETLTVIAPLVVLKGSLSGSLVLHQLGGMLPDGRFLQIWGRPDYVPGREVVVFAVHHESGEFQTAELLLGKFDVEEDAAGRRYAVPSLTSSDRSGISVYRESGQKLVESRGSSDGVDADDSESAPRELAIFEKFLASGATAPARPSAPPSGTLTPVDHSAGKRPLWGYISDSRYRWNNDASATWTLVNTANITGGGFAEATNALAAWKNEPHSNINYIPGPGSGNTIDLNATSVCGTSGCLSGAGVIGCGGPSGGGGHTWRGDVYSTIFGGFMQLRSYCTFNEYPSAVTQAVIEHELGHTLGLGHSDQNVSVHDLCRGDENAAIMRSVVQSSTPLGTDDTDAVRWLYGDGLTSCVTGPPLVGAISPAFGPAAGGTKVTIFGTNFAAGAAVTVGGVPLTGVTVVDAQTVKGTTGSHIAGATDVVVTNPDTSTSTLASGYTYSAAGVGFFTVTPCRLVDTRNAAGTFGGPALSVGEDRAFTIGGRCGVPASARAVAVNVTVTQPVSGPGFVTVYPGGASLPLASTLNYAVGQTRANDAVVSLGAGGIITVRCTQPSGTTHFILDVDGYFQ